MTQPKTTLGRAPWPGTPAPAPKAAKVAVPYVPTKVEDLSLCDDPLPSARINLGNKYGTLLSEALHTGRAIKTPAGGAQRIASAARKWLPANGHKGYAIRTVSDYGDGFGRVWLIKTEVAAGKARGAK